MEEYAFWVKTHEDTSLLLDLFLGALPHLESTSVEKCINIALSDVEGDGTIVCILLHFWPTGSLGNLWLSQETDSVALCKVLASAVGLFFFS